MRLYLSKWETLAPLITDSNILDNWLVKLTGR